VTATVVALPVMIVVVIFVVVTVVVVIVVTVVVVTVMPSSQRLHGGQQALARDDVRSKRTPPRGRPWAPRAWPASFDRPEPVVRAVTT
jgi:hypothetical protein